jgi:predicted nicotinamide N-methyase
MPQSSSVALKAWLDGLEATAGPLMREPGMEYGAQLAWWGARKPRPRPHEGIDLIFVSHERAPVPTIEGDGCVVALMDDFLGRTAIVERRSADHDGIRQYWVYAHMELAPAVQVGACLRKGQILGRAAVSTKVCPSHVHVSLLEAAVTPASWDDIGWRNIHDCSGLRFLPIDLHGNSSAPRQPRNLLGSTNATWLVALLLGGVCVLLAGFPSDELHVPIVWAYRVISRLWHSPPPVPDIPLFERVALPALPSGATLSLHTSNDRVDDAMPLGAELWPAAAALCRWQLEHMQTHIRGARILELGSGTGAVGLFAAGLGASQVMLTDRVELRELLERNAAQNARAIREGAASAPHGLAASAPRHEEGGGRNGGGARRVDVAVLDWRSDGGALEASFASFASFGGPFDLILGSDLTYAQEASSYEGLANALAALLNHSSGAAGITEGLHEAYKPTAAASLRSGRVGDLGTSASAATPRRNPTRIVLSHEHRSSRRRAALAASGRRKLRNWDDLDNALTSFASAASRHGLELSLLSSELPMGEIKGGFRRWSADVSIFEVRWARRG